jgi:hypothetical protein
MRRVAAVVVGLLLGVGIGATVALAVDDEPAGETGEPVATSVGSPSTTMPVPATSAAPPTTAPPRPEPPRDHVLLAWTAGGLTPGLADSVRALPGVQDLTVVRGDLVAFVAAEDGRGRDVQRLAPGWTIPLDVLAVDPVRYPDFTGRNARPELRRLGPGQAVLGETSAELRGVDVGGRLQLAGGDWLRVVAVVPDNGVAGAEAVVDLATGASIGVDRDRYLLLHHRGPRTPLDAAIRGLTGEAVRTRAVGETPFLRHADAVLPQALIKAEFGEFAVQGSGPGPVTIDPAWVDANIVTVDLPILGTARCHRDLIRPLRGALEDLRTANLGHLVGSFEGCYNPRTVAGSSQLSRHAWGAAVDLNFSTNPTGIDSVQDPRLVAVFERWGFGSGDFWLVPDSGHFEYIAPPSPSAT